MWQGPRSSALHLSAFPSIGVPNSQSGTAEPFSKAHSPGCALLRVSWLGSISAIKRLKTSVGRPWGPSLHNRDHAGERCPNRTPGWATARKAVLQVPAQGSAVRSHGSPSGSGRSHPAQAWVRLCLQTSPAQGQLPQNGSEAFPAFALYGTHKEGGICDAGQESWLRKDVHVNSDAALLNDGCPAAAALKTSNRGAWRCFPHSEAVVCAAFLDPGSTWRLAADASDGVAPGQRPPAPDRARQGGPPVSLGCVRRRDRPVLPGLHLPPSLEIIWASARATVLKIKMQGAPSWPFSMRWPEPTPREARVSFWELKTRTRS